MTGDACDEHWRHLKAKRIDVPNLEQHLKGINK